MTDKPAKAYGVIDEDTKNPVPRWSTYERYKFKKLMNAIKERELFYKDYRNRNRLFEIADE